MMELKDASLKYLTVGEFVKQFAFPTRTSIRYYIHFDRCQFASKCVVRIGKKILINVAHYVDWIQSHEKEGASNDSR